MWKKSLHKFDCYLLVTNMNLLRALLWLINVTFCIFIAYFVIRIVLIEYR